MLRLVGKYANGVQTISGPFTDREGKEFKPVSLPPISLDDLLTREFAQDQHFCTYDMDGEAFPRLLKGFLPKAREAGLDVTTSYIVLDWDVPKKGKDKEGITEEWLGEFLEKVYDAPAPFNQWAAVYPTSNGTRLIYRLQNPIPVDLAEQYIAGIISMWADKGLEFDEACKDWTRIFRAPKVVRDGKESWNKELFFVDTQDECLDLGKVIRVTTFARQKSSEVKDKSVPTSEEVYELLNTKNEATYRWNASQFYKLAKSKIKNKEIHSALFKGADLFQIGSRNNKIMTTLGRIIPVLLRSYRDLTPRHIFALIYDQLCTLEPDSGVRCWFSHAWKATIHIWEKEIEKYNIEQKHKAAEESKAVSLMDSMVDGMKGWCGHPEIHSDEESDRVEFMRTHSLVTMNKFFYLMDENGEYDSFCVTKDQLISRIRRTHLDRVVPTTTVNSQGEEVDATTVFIQNNYSSPVSKIVKRPQTEGRGFVEDIDGRRPVLVLPMYRRNPKLTGHYNKYVDKWLQHLFGENYDLACSWIANALAFEDGPICALSIKGPGGTGKKMLIEGLAECLEEPVVASGQDISGAFNGKLSNTPFLHINEGWPKGIKGTMSPSDLFKSLTAGDTISTQEKFGPIVDIVNPMRVVMTANDHDLLDDLTGGKDLSPESRKAVGDRLLHFDIDDAAITYLNRLGGPSFTSAKGHKWIRDDSGSNETDYVVARHFLWLYETRAEPDKKSRLLVMGNSAGSGHAMYSSILQRTSVSSCVKSIIRMVENKSGRNDTMRIDEETGQLYVTVIGMHDYIKTIMEEKISLRSTEMALKNVTTVAHERYIGETRWIEIDCSVILRFANSNGMECSVLRGIVHKQAEYRKQLEAKGEI